MGVLYTICVHLCMNITCICIDKNAFFLNSRNFRMFFVYSMDNFETNLTLRSDILTKYNTNNNLQLEHKYTKYLMKQKYLYKIISNCACANRNKISLA